MNFMTMNVILKEDVKFNMSTLKKWDLCFLKDSNSGFCKF